MRIGILTGGGDVPGLNTVIHDVTYRARHEKNVEVVGIKRGWGGLIYMDPTSKTMDPEHALMLNEGNVRGIDRDGGTFLKSSRIFPLKVKPHQKLKEYRGIHFEGVRDMTSDVLANLENLGIEKLIVIGGDDTLSYARHLHEQGFPVIGVPKTMDGDVAGTDYCIGFNTAISRACRSITDLRTSAGSHERIGIVELFGRHSGFTALYSAIASKADRVIIPEVPFDIRVLSNLILDDKKSSPARYSILLVAEGAIPIGGREETMNGGVDAYGHAKLGGIGKRVADDIKAITGEEVMNDILTYVLRSGAPSAKDKVFGTAYANTAMNGLLRGESGKLAALQNGKISLVDLALTAQSPKMVDIGRDYCTKSYRPNFDSLEGFVPYI